MKKKIAERIRVARYAKNLNQQNMADELNIKLATYSNIERGITDITVTRLYQIAKILEVSPLTFMQEDPSAMTADPLETYHTTTTNQLFLLTHQVQELQKWVEALQQEIRDMKKASGEESKN